MSATEYITDRPWRFTYHHSLSPSNIRFIQASQRRVAPKINNYCELAYGQGVSLLIHAACNQEILWTGTDFNPGHAKFARGLAQAARIENLALRDQSFIDFSERTDLPVFDIITNIGTWSWLGENDLSAIIALLARNLNPGGKFCLAHGVLPGQNSVMGLVKLFSSFSLVNRLTGSVREDEIPKVMAETLAFFNLNPAFADLHWNLRNIFEKLREKDPAELAHEYFNHNFHPAYFGDVAKRLESARLKWDCHWHAMDALDELHLLPRQRDYLRNIEDPVRREQFRDILLNTSSRTDVWCADGSAISPNRLDLLEPFTFVLARPIHYFEYKIQTNLGEIALSRDLYFPMLQKLGTLRPAGLADLHAHHSGKFTRDEIADALAILVDQEFLQVVNPDAGIAASMAPAHRLNAHILDLTRKGGKISHLGSPITGTGLKVSRLHQLFLLARADGARTVQAFARFAIAALTGTPSKSEKNPVTPRDPVLLERDAESFVQHDLPIYDILKLTATP